MARVYEENAVEDIVLSLTGPQRLAERGTSSTMHQTSAKILAERFSDTLIILSGTCAMAKILPFLTDMY